MTSPKSRRFRRLVRHAGAFAAFIAAMGGGFVYANDKTGAAVFGALPHVSETAISPDGRTLAQIQSLGGGKRAVVFVDVDGKAAAVGMGLEKAKARSLKWVGDEHVLLLVSAAVEESFGDGLKTYEIWRWVVIDRAAKKKSVLFKSARYGYFNFGSGVIECFGDADPGTIVLAHRGGYSLYDIDLASGSEKLKQSGEETTFGWILNSACDPIARIDYDWSKEENRYYRAKAGGGFEFKSAVESKIGADDAIAELGVIDSAGGFAGLAIDGGFLSLRPFDLDAGAFKPGSESVAGFDLASTIVDPYTDRIVGVRYSDDFPRARYLLEPLKTLQKNASNVFKGASAVVTSWSRDHSRAVVEVSYPDHPSQDFLFEPAKKSMTVIGSAYPKLDGLALPRRLKFDYPASDGIEIRGYLTTPVGDARGPRPLIVLPHGGPELRDTMSFDWWAAYYAANGYLVYQPNFRGSFGYGEAFRKAGDGQWGRKMQDDISEGVKKLIADGRADAGRVCIVGSAYGGYAALAGATLTPDIYACAVSVNGISNLPDLISSENEPTEKYWTKRIGSVFKDKYSIAAVSPSKQVTKATPPIMLIQSSDDIVVPPGQSVLMRKALEQANRPVEYLRLQGEDHWLSNERTRIEMLEASLAFINKHIGAN